MTKFVKFVDQDGNEVAPEEIIEKLREKVATKVAPKTTSEAEKPEEPKKAEAPVEDAKEKLPKEVQEKLDNFFEEAANEVPNVKHHVKIAGLVVLGVATAFGALTTVAVKHVVNKAKK